MAGHFEPKLIGDYDFGEVASSLQKMIRKGKEYEACYWAYILHQSGYGLYLWRRLAIIASEDVGGGDNMGAVMVDALRNNWLDVHKQVKEPVLDKLLFAIQAVLYLCRAKKSRECDSLTNLIDEKWKLGERLPVLEISKDCHTDVGRKIFGRFGANDGKEQERITKWFLEWGRVENEAYKDPWQPELEQVWRDNDKKRQNSVSQSVANE